MQSLISARKCSVARFKQARLNYMTVDLIFVYLIAGYSYAAQDFQGELLAEPPAMTEQTNTCYLEIPKVEKS